jgi:hypothetical protein
MSSALDSVPAFTDRAEQIGVERWIIDKLVEKKFATFGRLAFAFPYSPQTADDTAFKRFLADALGDEIGDDQLSTLRRLFFESHTMALTDVRLRSEASPDPSQASRRLPTAERVARQREQQKRLGGLIFEPSTIPANHLVDLYVDMVDTGVLTYVKAENCCSRAQEVEAIKKDPTVSTDSSGLLKLSTKQSDQHCEANTELRLRAAWQRRNLAMDLAGLATFEKAESWTQFLFTQLMKDQPKGFSRISIQQLVDCDKHLFVLASHMTMGKLTSVPGEPKPMDQAFDKLRDSSEVLQYLTPLPTVRVHDSPAAPGGRPTKVQKTEKGAKGSGKSQSAKGSTTPRVQVPDGCTSHDSDNKPLCFAYQQGKCKFKGPAGKRCARGYHKCYKQGCYRHKPFYLCNHSD